MIEKEDIQKLFTQLYGVNVDLKTKKVPEPPAVDHTKTFFMRSVMEWRSAHKIKEALLNKYGIDFEGYDTQLFDSLESIYFSFLGPVKSSIITSYVYCPINLEVETFLIRDKNGKEYIIDSVEDLYYFIVHCKDEDFLQDQE